MPELPDLLFINKYLQSNLVGRTITETSVKQPVTIRMGIDKSFDAALQDRRVAGIELHGPFINFRMTDSVDLILNLMLMGRLQHQKLGEKSPGHICFSLHLDDTTRLHMCDEQKMAKAYVVAHGNFDAIPKYTAQGTDIRSPEFTIDLFRSLASTHSRKQVRVFINDHTIMSSIGNAYADEILFDAKIHPKTFVYKLSPEEIDTLYHSIRSVMDWGIAKVEEVNAPIHRKVREHMKVRNRKGEPCPQCGTTIRREGVRGHDVFFCPTCQPASRALFINWNHLPTED